MKSRLALEPPPDVAGRIDALERLADLLEQVGVFVTGYDVGYCCRTAEIAFEFSPTAGVKAMRAAMKHDYRPLRVGKVSDCGVDGEIGRPYWVMEIDLD